MDSITIVLPEPALFFLGYAVGLATGYFLLAYEIRMHYKCPIS